ncbi:MAG TPA: IPTL-CTERM sorting domain-containing protein [Casimicrobiaceae bacterium]
MERRAVASFRRVIATIARLPVFAAALLAFAAPALASINANKSFTPDVVSVGQVSTVTLFFLNANTSIASALAFTDVLPTGIVVAPAPSPSTTCGGSLAPNAGDTSVSFSGGAIPAAVGATPGTCQVTFNVVATASDVYINTMEAGDVTSSEGSNSQDAEATLNVTALAPISGTKSFAPAFLHGYGDPSTVTITLNNPNGVALTNLTFTDILPAQLALSPTPVAATTCGGTLTPNTVSSPNRMALAGGSIPANGSCTVTFGVIAAAPNTAANGNVQNTIPAGDITTFEGVTNPLITSNNLLLQTGAQLVKAFAPTTINSGGTSTLTVTVRNYNAQAITPIGFPDPLPGVMRVAAAPNTGGTCVTVNGGSFSAAVPGTATYTTAGGSLPGVPSNAAANVFTSCTYTIDVTALNAATAPLALSNTIAAGNFGGVGYLVSNAAVLTVVRPSTLSGSKSLTTIVGPAVQTNTILATVVINNSAAVPATSLAMTDLLTTMGAGYTFAAAPIATSSCGGAFGATGGTSVTFTGGTIPASSNCTLTFPIQIAANAATGTRTNTIAAGGITVTGDTNTSPLAASIAVGAALTVAKAFNPTTVFAGADTRLTITIAHANGAVAFTNVAFTDTLPALPAAHVVSTNPNAVTTCAGGTVTANPGAGTISLSGGTLAVGATSCTVAVNVTTPGGSGAAINTLAIGSVTSAPQGVANVAAAAATITRITGTVSLAKSFTPATVALNGTSVMRVRILNNAPGAIALTGVALSDLLPTGMVVHSTPAATFTGTGCSPAGVNTAAPNGATVAITAKSVAVNAICTIQVTVRATAAGNLINQIAAGALTSAQGVSNIDPVAATLASTGLANLSVTKTDGVTQVAAGATTTYTVVVTNAAGSANVIGALFTDPEPANATFPSWSCIAAPATASCTASGSGSISDTVNIPAGATLTYTVTAAVPAGASGQVVNVATIDPPASVIDGNPANNSATDTDNIVQQVALALTKTDNSATYVPGGTGTYVVTVTNGGPSNGTGISYADTLPGGVVIAAPGVSCTPTGIASCGSAGANTVGTNGVSFTGMQIGAGAGNSVQVSVPVSYSASMTNSPLVNTAQAMHVASGNSASGQDSSTRAPDIVLAVTKTDGSATYVPGGTATYTVVVTNNGVTDALSVAVTDTLPTGVTLTGNVTCVPSALSDCGIVTGTTGQTAFGATVAVIRGGGTLTFTVPVAFDILLTDASITNTATATATDPQLPPPGTVSAQGSDTDTRAAVDLGIVKSHTGNFFQGQAGATFSIVVTNNGLSPTFGTVTVSDVVPAGLTATAIAGTNWSCTQPAGPCTRSDPLGATQSYDTITLTVDVATSAGTPLVNQATVSGGGDPTPATSNDTVVVDVGRDLTITKTHAGSFFQGQVGAQFTIGVSNVGGTASTGTVTVTESLPAGLTATAMSGTGWSCSQPAGPCTRSDVLAPTGAYPVITLTVDVASTAGSPLLNVATVSGGGDINPTNNTANDFVTVVGGPDLAIAKSHAGTFFQGQVGAQFTITVNNLGLTPSLGTVTVSDVLPTGLTATGIAGTGWTCTQPGGPCTRSDVLAPAGVYPTITLTVDVAPNAGTTLVNTATVAGGGDVNPANNSANDTVTVVGGPDLAIAKTHSGNFFQGQIGAQFTITVNNLGLSPSVGTVTVSDVLPTGLAATAIGGTGWTCTQPAGSCTRSDALPPAGVYPTITLTVDVAGNAGSPLLNTATVSGGGDINSSNNSASDSVTVALGPDLRITKTHAGSFTLGQAGATYTITVSNAGNSATVGTVDVTDIVPAGLTATAIAGINWACTQPAGPCSRSDALAPAGSYEPITLTVNVSTSAPPSVVNTATVSGGGDVDPSNNTATDPTTIAAALVRHPVPTLGPVALTLLSLLLLALGWRRARFVR